MYAFVIVKEMFHTYHKDKISPVDFYVAKDQWEFQLTSALLLAVFAMLIYARLHQTSVSLYQFRFLKYMVFNCKNFEKYRNKIRFLSQHLANI